MSNNLITQLYLASKSPRRATLLSQHSFIFKTIIPEAQETLDPDPIIRTTKNAQLKALSVIKQISSKGVALGVDTVVVVDNLIYGKPHTGKENYVMLQKMAGREHQVITSLALVNYNSSIIRTHYEITTVYMRKVTDKELRAYIKTEEGIDKAGGYGIQGKGVFLIERINGCYNNVVGMPVTRLMSLLQTIPEIKIGSILPWLDPSKH